MKKFEVTSEKVANEIDRLLSEMKQQREQEEQQAALVHDQLEKLQKFKQARQQQDKTKD